MRTLSIVGCLTVLAFSMSQFAVSTAAPQDNHKSRKLWEYRIFDAVSAIEEGTDAKKGLPEIENAINKLGSEGWELQSMQYNTLIFKREKQM